MHGFGALPVASLGTKLDSEFLRIALGLHLGVPIVVKHTCVCVGNVDVYIYRVLMVCHAGVASPTCCSK